MKFAIMLVALSLGLFAEEKSLEEIVRENDLRFQQSAKEYLKKHSTCQDDQTWKKKLKDFMEQRMHDFSWSLQSALDQAVLDWAAGRDFNKLTAQDKVNAARYYLTYRDADFSPFDIRELQLPERVLQALEEKKIIKLLEDLDKRFPEVKK